MRKNQSAFRRKPDEETPSGQVLLVGDILKHLSGLARLHREKKVGNVKLSRGLNDLVRALRPYAESPISELSDAIASACDARNVDSASTPALLHSESHLPLNPGLRRNDGGLNGKRFHSRESAAGKSVSGRLRSDLPSDLESLCHEDVERILDDGSYTKKELAELGFRRFGISRSSLTHLRKEDALKSIKSALENELILGSISEMAQRAGRARTN